MQRNESSWINLLIQIVFFGGVIFCINMQFFGRKQMAAQAFVVSAYMLVLVIFSYGIRRCTQKLKTFSGLQIAVGGMVILGGFMLPEQLLQTERIQGLWAVAGIVLCYTNWSFAVKLNESSLKSYEYLSWKYGVFLVAAYGLGKVQKNGIWIQAEMILILCFVLLQIIHHYKKAISELFCYHESKKNFPKEQIVIVTKVLTMAVCAVVVILSVALYHGPYGNLELLILKVLKYIFIFPLSILLKNKGGLPQTEATEESTTEEIITYTMQYTGPAETESTIEISSESIVNNNTENHMAIVLLLVMVMYFVIFAVLLLIVQGGFRYWKKLRSHYVFGEDEMEAWEKEMETHTTEEKICYREDRGEGTYAKKVRAFYKKRVLRAVESTEPGLPDRPPEKTALPEEITRQYFKEAQQKEEITRIYEKARYSKEAIKKEELRKLDN